MHLIIHVVFPSETQWILHQTNMLLQYGVVKAGGPKPYWDGNQWAPPPVILTTMEEPQWLQSIAFSLAVAHCKKHPFDILKPAVSLTVASPVYFLLKPQVFHWWRI